MTDEPKKAEIGEVVKLPDCLCESQTCSCGYKYKPSHAHTKIDGEEMILTFDVSWYCPYCGRPL